MTKRPCFHFLPILLWLCVEDPDITNMKDERIEREQLFKPKYTIHKKTGVFVPPSQPIVFNLGKRLGSEIATGVVNILFGFSTSLWAFALLWAR